MLEVSPDIWWSVKGMRLSMGRDSNVRPRPQHRYCFKRSTTRSVTTRSVTRNIYYNMFYLWQFLLRDTIPAGKILNSGFHTTHATWEYAQRNASVVCRFQPAKCRQGYSRVSSSVIDVILEVRWTSRHFQNFARIRFWRKKIEKSGKGMAKPKSLTSFKGSHRRPIFLLLIKAI